MQQVLFTIPLETSLTPEGIPIHAFGVVLFCCFIICTWFATKRAQHLGFTRERMDTLALVLFLSGILGARIVYMIQYRIPLSKFFHIWEGGIVLYGSIIGGFIGFWVFYFLVLKRLKIQTWQLGDAIAPALALGIGIGRIGCLLNGCCYGQVAPEQCPRIGFPLTTAPVREVVVDNCQYQTLSGFTVKPFSLEDVRSVVNRVEKGSNAERAGLQPGDKILEVNRKPNGAVLSLVLPEGKVAPIKEWFTSHNASVEVFETSRPDERRLKITIPDAAKAGEIILEAQRTLQLILNSSRLDTFREMLLNWPKGRHDLELTVERAGQPVKLDFTPRSIGLHPTQIYETISMFLLTLLLVAFYPFRRHDGQVFVLFILCYAVHRFLNEILRDDTSPVAFNMTLSQNISLLMLCAGIVLEGWLRYTQPRLRGMGNGEWGMAKPEPTPKPS